MLLVDANVLLYGTNSASPHFERCHDWLEESLGGIESVGFSWIVLLGFLRIATKRAVFPKALTITQALDQVDVWLAQPASVVVHPDEGHAAALRRFLESVGTAGDLTSDAHLAALAFSQGATIVSCDDDFRRFKGVKTINPLD